jgi:glucan phosphorylase
MTDATRHPVRRAGGAHGRVRCDDTGCYTKTTNNLHLWESKPKRGFDLNSFNAGNYEGAVEASNSAAAITSVLYPNDHTSCAYLFRST